MPHKSSLISPQGTKVVKEGRQRLTRCDHSLPLKLSSTLLTTGEQILAHREAEAGESVGGPPVSLRPVSRPMTVGGFGHTC